MNSLRRSLMAGPILLIIVFLQGCGKQSPNFTLYRNSPLSAELRIHFASFDAKESGNYNQENCSVTAELLNKEAARMTDADPTVRYWCERGRFKQ